MPSCSEAGAVHVVIPARWGSTRLPGKPLIDLAGEPMIVRVYQRVREALGELADIAVATDDARVFDVLASRGVAAVMTDPSHPSGTDRVAEVATLRNWADGDLIVNVQGDEPLVPGDLLRAFVAFCADDPVFQMGTVASPVREHVQIHDPNVVKVVLNQEGRALLFSRSPIPFVRDTAPDAWPLSAFLRHIGIYAYRRSVIGLLTSSSACVLEQAEKLEQLRALWLDIPVRTMTWPDSPPHGVDTPEDAERVSQHLLAAGGGGTS